MVSCWFFVNFLWLDMQPLDNFFSHFQRYEKAFNTKLFKWKCNYSTFISEFLKDISLIRTLVKGLFCTSTQVTFDKTCLLGIL